MRIPKLFNLLLPQSLVHHIPHLLLIILYLFDLDIRRQLLRSPSEELAFDLFLS